MVALGTLTSKGGPGTMQGETRPLRIKNRKCGVLRGVLTRLLCCSCVFPHPFAEGAGAQSVPPVSGGKGKGEKLEWVPEPLLP